MSSQTFSDQVFEGTFLIIKCHYRIEDQGPSGGWYRVFGSGGFWNVPLLDRWAGCTTTASPYPPGKALTGARLRPRSEPDSVAKNMARFETFSLLIPRATAITLAEL